jgi:hypothetical protein
MSNQYKRNIFFNFNRNFSDLQPLKAILFAAALIIIVSFCSNVQAVPRLLTYSEIVRLYSNPAPSAALSAKLNALLTTPFVVNNAAARGIKPREMSASPLGQFMRVAFWNIERGLELPLIKLAMTDPEGFAAKLDVKKYPLDSLERKSILEESKTLSEADVIVLNEADWGVKRSGYHNVAEEIARATNMNYAWNLRIAVNCSILRRLIPDVIAVCTERRFSAATSWKTCSLSPSNFRDTTGMRMN